MGISENQFAVLLFKCLKTWVAQLVIMTTLFCIDVLVDVTDFKIMKRRGHKCYH